MSHIHKENTSSDNKPLEPTLMAIETLLSTLHNSPFYRDYIVRGSYVSRQWMQPYSRTCHDLDLLYLQDYKPDRLIKQVEYLAIKSDTQYIFGFYFQKPLCA